MALRRVGEAPEPVAQAEPPKKEAVAIKNWDDWFVNCKTVSELLKKYEDTMLKYYQLQCSKTDDGQAAVNRLYLQRHDTGFYDQETDLPGWFLRKWMKLGALAGALVLILTCIIFGILAVMGANDAAQELAKYLEESGGPLMYFGLRCILPGFLVFALVTGIPCLLHKTHVKKLCLSLSMLEKKLIPVIGVIPPKYRNWQSCDGLYDVYCSYGVVMFAQAVSMVDEYLQKNQLNGLYLACMFDQPYTNALSGTDLSDVRTKGNVNQEALNDPNLPKDIESKTFSGVEDADKALEKLIGLDNVKAQVRQMKNRIEFYSSGADQVSGNHMVFLGPPGTGKTTIARILTKILNDFGYIRENRCVEIDGGYLRSEFQGQTAARTEAIMKYSLGGVLFIDEAYTLMEGGSSGKEAEGVLLKYMEDYRADLVIIMAGYEDNINRMLGMNEGYASRIKHKIYFDNFSVDELIQMFRRYLKNQITNGQHYKMEKTALEHLRKHFEKERKIPGFGNARVVRNTWDKILEQHADNFINRVIPEEKRYVITKEDVDMYIEVRQKQMQIDGRNFIASRNLDTTVISLQELKQKTKRGSADPDADLAKLTGLSKVKNEIDEMKAQFAFYDGKMESEGNHMVFLGPPGTGKTTVASIMTGYLYQMGLISDNSYLDINGDFLRGMYLGHTGKRTEAVIQYSQGMVLFIDEAYLLSSNGTGENNSFGQEAVGVLIDAMEKYRKNFVVIFAGYEKEMRDFLDMNSGLQSRINLTFHFQSYTPDELADMLKRLAAAQKFKVDAGVWEPLKNWLAVESQDPKFGNGRFIRQLFEDLKKRHIMNYSKKLYTDKQKYVIMKQDLLDLIEKE